jgi:hypothetical protein
MSHVRPRSRIAALAIILPLGLAACETGSRGYETSAPPPAAPAPVTPASIPAQDIVGRWGLASYHKDADRPRTEAAARSQCSHPYNIGRGTRGGVIMHLADQSQPAELMLKGGPGGKNFVGPFDEPGGAQQDREIMSFDGRVMLLRYVDPEVHGRYGIQVYVRCTARG